MIKRNFAKDVLNVGVNHFRRVLEGERGLSYLKAKKASEVLGGEIDLWIGFDRGRSERLMVNRRHRWEQWERVQR